MAAVKPWFKVKKYGYGWTPQTFEGWVVTLAYALLVVVLSIIYCQRLTDPLFDPKISTGIYAFLLAALTIGLIAICYAQGEKPHWRWGNKKK